MTNVKEMDINDFSKQIHKIEGNEFSSLMPLFEEFENDKLEEYIIFKTEDQKQILSRIKKSPSQRITDEEGGLEIDLEEDALISDPYYATILNRDREILVGNEIYLYDIDGIYVVAESDIQLLYDYLDEVKDSNTNGRLLRPINIKLIDPYDDYVDNNSCVVGDPCDTSNDYNPNTSSSNSNIAGNVFTFNVCDQLNTGLFTTVFGPKVTCTDYYDSRTRIKTKVWNQNYFLWASVGMSVRSQKRYLRIWWRQKADELRLGYAQASFRYKTSIQWPNNNIPYYFEDLAGNLTDQYGSIINDKRYHPKSIFDNFPINDKDDVFFTIYTKLPIIRNLLDSAFDDVAKYEIQGEKINTAIKTMFKSTVKSIWKYGDKVFEEQPVLTVEAPSDGNGKISLTFTYTNWKRSSTNEGRIANVFDWNTAQLKFKTNIGDGVSTGFSNFSVKSTSSSYDKLLLTGYGMGKRGDIWKGSRVIFKDN